MKYICLKCKRTSVDGNLWCQEKYCPAENAVEILDNGEWFGDIEIVDLLTVLHSATIYIAKRDENDILLKVAHDDCFEKLKREAQTLLELNQKKHPMLPELLSAHKQASVSQYPYGKLVLNGKVRYYEVFQYAEGDILRNYLLKQAQPWYQYVGWLVLSLSDALTLMHHHKKLHLCLSPEVVLVRFDKQNYPRPMLLDLGIASSANEVVGIWNKQFTLPAYTAPELIKMQGKVGAATDVYGLGLLLYEMLRGIPAFEFRLHKDDEIYASVLEGNVPPVGRSDLKNIPDLAEIAVKKDYALRQSDIPTFAKELQKTLPAIPAEKKGFEINWWAVTIVLAAALAISLILVLAAI